MPTLGYLLNSRIILTANLTLSTTSQWEVLSISYGFKLKSEWEFKNSNLNNIEIFFQQLI